MRFWWLARCGWAVAAVSSLGCSDEQVAPAPVSAPPFRHESFYAHLSDDAAAFTQRHGDWLEDLGDAPFYGLAFHAHRDPLSGAALAARDRSLTLLQAEIFTHDLSEVAMSTLGLIEYYDATRDASVVPVIDAFIDELDQIVRTVGFYIAPGSIDSWALTTYGSTAISALLALINTEYAVRVGGARAADRVAFAVEAADRIASIAAQDVGFLFGPDRPEMLCLYPNVSMILLDGRLFQLTGEERYRERALRSYQAIQPLKLGDGPVRYYSPYSAASMGAQSNDYSTLSSHNYLMLALPVLFEVTQDVRFAHELDGVLDAMSGELYGSWCLSDVHHETCAPACDAGQACVADACSVDRCSGGVLHHFIDGRAALPSDPEYFCSGCNLQLLYVMWYRRTRL